ncbi:type II toxin-antitoxin system RelE/ParE family toxin [Rhizobium sp. 9140]|uniref:type II toxin-antitoxin system RelE/ParE family toxin n=1 Tax=Rhizobium sp. 9140 TaxID=1761900 RepID=UPI000AB8DD94|nr:type II toxin-antitoxin system RelE/ParE family toxin [Rhizobium sp. 9140]
MADAFDYIAEENAVAADAFVTDITNHIEGMAGLGLIGTSRPFVAGLRCFVYRERCIYFFVTETELNIARVLHGRRAISASTFIESDTD